MRISMVLACVVGLLGCSKDSPKTPAPAAEVPVNVGTMAALQSLGDRAPFVLVLDPRRWAEVHQRIAPLLEALPAPLDTVLSDLATAEDMSRLVGQFAMGEGPIALRSWDPDRPVVGAFYEAAVDGPPGAVAELLPIGVAKSLPGFRHRILIPARDANTLADAIRPRLPRGSRIIVSEGLVEVIVVTEGEGTPPAIWSEPPPKSPETPALRALAAGDAAIGLVVRPWRLRAWHGQRGLTLAHSAIAHAPEDIRLLLAAAGTGEVLAGSRMMTASDPEFDDHAVILGADGEGVSIRGVSSLTPTGAKLFAAGSKRPSRIFAVKIGALLQLSMRFDVGAAISAAAPRGWFADSKTTLPDVTRRFAECGLGCPVHSLLRAPFGTARSFRDHAPGDLMGLANGLPWSVQMVVVSVMPPKIAWAADVPGDFAIEALKGAVAPGTQIHLEDGVLLAGTGIDPRTVFDTTKAVEGDLASLRLNLPQLHALVRSQMPPAEAFVAPIRQVEGEAAIGDRALNWRLFLSTSKAAIGPLTSPKSRPWSSPVRGTSPGKGATCLLEAVTHASEAFRALHRGPTDQHGQLLATATREMAPALDCADADPATRGAAQGLRRMLAVGPPVPAPPSAPASQAPMSAAPVAPGTEAGVVQPDRPLVKGSLDKAVIQQVIRAQQPKVRYCYEKGLSKDPKLAGTVMLDFVIQADGTVGDVKTLGATALSAAVAGCIQGVVAKMRFPKPSGGGIVKVKYPFVFRTN